MNFRENLVHLRAVNNMTQEQLAMLLGVSRQSVAKWEAGKSYPEMDKLISLCQVFHCTLDELVQGNLTDKECDPILARSVATKPEDIFGYDEEMRSFASKISNGVMAIILGVALSIPFIVIGDQISSWEASSLMFHGVGVLILFVGIAVGLALIIPAGLANSAFVKEHPYIADFYTSEQKLQARTTFTRELIGGICCIFAGVCTTVFLAHTSYEDVLGAPTLLVLIALGIRSIIHGGMTLSRTNLAEYNKKSGNLLTPEDIEAADLSSEQKEQMMASHRVNKRVGAICGTIMIVATIAGLVMLFVPEYYSDLFWLAWPIGGLCCGIVSILIKGFSKSDN